MPQPQQAQAHLRGPLHQKRVAHDTEARAVVAWVRPTHMACLAGSSASYSFWSCAGTLLVVVYAACGLRPLAIQRQITFYSPVSVSVCLVMCVWECVLFILEEHSRAKARFFGGGDDHAPCVHDDAPCFSVTPSALIQTTTRTPLTPPHTHISPTSTGALWFIVLLPGWCGQFEKSARGTLRISI